MPEIINHIDEAVFTKIYSDLMSKGVTSSPRGLLIMELLNYQYILPPYVRFANFEARKLNVNYIKNEFLWYLKGDRYDDSITKYAKMWNEVKNPDGSINSNYGQYIFGRENQFDRVLLELLNDPDSRRASIIILKNEHYNSKSDIPCTYSLNFKIRDSKLIMTVRMRSQDAVLGLGSDCPIFSFIHEMMLHKLRVAYVDLQLGDYVHSADSFHIYERHYEMVKSLLNEPKYSLVVCSLMKDASEVDFIRKLDFTSIPEDYLFTKWLTNIV